MKRGFTLLEIVMVIATILILAAIIFPVVSRAKDGGKLTTTMNNSKQLGQALAHYASDHDEHLPPSTNYAAKESAKERLWTNLLLPFVGKSEKVFVADGSEGVFASKWSERGGMTMGLNSALAYDPKNGCKDNVKDSTGCLAFRSVVQLSDLEEAPKIALIASTPGGAAEDGYRGYEFSPYNNPPLSGKPEDGTPLASDRDLVAAMASSLPADLIRPIYARYFRDNSDNGRTPVVFADGHAKSYSAKEVKGRKDGIIWRLR